MTMTAVTVHHEAAAERTLSEAPPEQWDALLQALGASVRPVEKHIHREAPFTVTSLLGMMEPLAADDDILSKPMAPLREVKKPKLDSAEELRQQAKKTLLEATTSGALATALAKVVKKPKQEVAEPKQGGSEELRHQAKQTLLEVPRGGAAGRSRARRRPLPAPTLPVQQDTRDLEELLRELGEIPAVGVPVEKAKKKGKAGGKTAAKQPARGTPKPTLRPPALAAQEVAPEKLSPEEVYPEEVALEETAAQHMSPEEASPEEVSLEEAAAQDASPEDASPEEVAPENVHLEEGSAAVPQDEMAAKSLPEEACAAIDIRLVETCVCDDAVLVESGESATTAGASAGEHRSSMSHSLSEGALPKACHRTQFVESAPCGYFELQPSVGTWLHRPSRAEEWCRRSSSAEVLPESRCNQLCGPQDFQCDPATWHAQPSVGTWLVPRSQAIRVGAHRESSGGFRAASISHSRDTARTRSCSQVRDVQLWPATPTSTPPLSPRHPSDPECNAMVWMPIPVHMVAEVQQLLSRGAAQHA